MKIKELKLLLADIPDKYNLKAEIFYKGIIYFTDITDIKTEKNNLVCSVQLDPTKLDTGGYALHFRGFYDTEEMLFGKKVLDAEEEKTKK